MHIKSNLSKHRLSFILSWSWALFGLLVFFAIVEYLPFPVSLDPISPVALKPMLWGSCICYFIVAWFMISVRRLPYSNNLEVLLVTALVMTCLLLIFLAATREFYSGTYLATYLVFQVFWFGLEVFFRNRYVEYRFAVFPSNFKLVAEDFPEYKVVFSYSPEELEDGDIDAVIVNFNQEMSSQRLATLAYCQNNSIPILPLTLFLENMWGRIPPEMVNTDKILEESPFRPYLLVKPALSWLMAAVGVIVTSPLMLATAILVKLTSPGPILFKQERIGYKGRRFAIYKFRTMLNGVEKLGSYAAVEGDERLTSVGKFLRKYHLDELPQLFNVLKGELTIVGPRPESADLYELYDTEMPYSLRTLVQQGITSWALIHQGNVCGVDSARVKLSYDLYYVKHASLFLDFYIILKTFWVLVIGIETLSAPDALRVLRKKNGDCG